MSEHMKVMTVAKDEKSKPEDYIMALAKKNKIKSTLSDVTSKPTMTDVHEPLSIKIIVQPAYISKKEKATGSGK